MAHVLIMPRQGNTVESCIIVEWKVKEGDAVQAETIVCEVETDKATFDVPAGEAGKILKILKPDGDDVPVLEAIAVIGADGEDWKAALGSAAPAEAPAATAAPEAPKAAEAAPANSAATAAPAASQTQGGDLKVSPRAKNLAAKEALSLDGVGGTGPGGRIIERDVEAALALRPELTAAAKAAIASGAAVPSAGSGMGGRVTSADLAGSPAAAPTVASSAPRSTVDLPFPGAFTETPVKGIRKLISDRMSQSLATTAQFTLSASANATRAQALRARMKASSEELGLAKVTINDLVLFAASRVLPLYPFMNAKKEGDVLKTFERVHLGLAVDTPKGLMVPVIRNADLLSLAQISAEAKRLAVACQSGTAKPDDLSGSTFTVSNLGAMGIESFTPVLNAPEVAILGVCGIEPKPIMADDGQVSFAPHIGFSLTINHQVVDGAPAARFLAAFRAAVADIDLWLAK